MLTRPNMAANRAMTDSSSVPYAASVPVGSLESRDLCERKAKDESLTSFNHRSKKNIRGGSDRVVAMIDLSQGEASSRVSSQRGAPPNFVNVGLYRNRKLTCDPRSVG